MDSNLLMFKYKVVSVPHTGTRFTLEFLKLLQVSPITREHIIERDYGLSVVDVPENVRMVIPRRDPGRTYISRCQRRAHYQDQPHYERTNDGTPLSKLLAQYERLENLLSKYSNQCMILPIDKPIPSDFWREFSNFLTIPHENFCDADVLTYIKEWKKVGAFEYKYPNVEVSPEIEAIREKWGYK